MARTSRTITVAALFRKKPPHWGLRGDPFLWDEMARDLTDVACPSTPDGVRSLIEDAFAKLTGLSMSNPDSIFVERYSHGGMSSGHVCPMFWRDMAMPFLLDRLAQRSRGGTVEYRITKECGVGWGEPLPAIAAWGVSESQRRLAKNVIPGDILLHYIDHAHAWAGYSVVSDVLQKNDRDSHPDWLAALPDVIPINRGIWLNMHQCEHTAAILGLPDKHYNRQVAFTSVPASEAKLIIAAIDAAQAVQSMASDAFQKRWRIGAENYYGDIVRGLAGGKCWLCGDDAASWATRAGMALSKEELESICDSFLDVAHIKARSNLGPMTPDNLRALCPNCHRFVDRLSEERREKFLRNK